MSRLRNILKWGFAIAIAVIIAFTGWFYLSYGGKGIPFPSMATVPAYPADSLHIVAMLSEPPGNLAVSAVCGKGSYAQDMQIDTACRKYTSPILCNGEEASAMSSI